MKPRLPAAVIVIGVLSCLGGVLGIALDLLVISIPLVDSFFPANPEIATGISLGKTWIELTEWFHALFDAILGLLMIVFGVSLLRWKRWALRATTILAVVVLASNLVELPLAWIAWRENHSDDVVGFGPFIDPLMGMTLGFAEIAVGIVTFFFIAWSVAALVVLRRPSVVNCFSRSGTNRGESSVPNLG
jgi:hypothetical protein